MKKMVITLSGVLVLIMIIFSINYTIKLEDYEIKINGTTYALTIDGENVNSIPTSGDYYLINYTCENGSIITWNTEEHALYIEGMNANTDKCNLEFDSNPLLNTMKVGDYVAYVGNNGCLNGETGTTGASDAEAGNSCLGENANQSEDTSGYTYGYCEDVAMKFFVYGWRIAYIENGKVHLVSAGCPECRTRTSSTANATQIADLNLASLDYCNATYADGGSCPTDNSNTWAMGNTDYQKITYALFGVSSNLMEVYGSPFCYAEYSKKTCGYNNDLINNGAAYWFAAYEDTTSTEGVLWTPYHQYSFSNDRTYAYGFRPVIRLSSSVYVTGGVGTMENPYKIGIG